MSFAGLDCDNSTMEEALKATLKLVTSKSNRKISKEYYDYIKNSHENSVKKYKKKGFSRTIFYTLLEGQRICNPVKLYVMTIFVRKLLKFPLK